MARPTDWSKLGLDSDPTPGNQDTMAALAKIMHQVQGKVDEMETTINGIVNNVAGGWTGKTADALRGQISDQLQQFFRGLQQCFDEATPAIDTFNKALAQHQSDADTALTKALALPDKDPGLAQYTQAAKQAGTDLTTAANTAAGTIDDAVGKLASALTPSEIFWEAFQWLALILGVVGLIFGGPLAILAWLANIALFIKSIVDFAHGDTNFLGLFLGFLGIIAPMTRGIGGDLANLLKGGFTKLIGGVDKITGDLGNIFGNVKNLFVDFSSIGVLGSIKVIGVFAIKGGMWVFDKILTFPTLVTKIGAIAFDKFVNFDQYLISGLKLLGDGLGKGVDFVLTEIGTGRFVRLFLPVMKDEFTALGFGGALWRAFERTLPGIVPFDKVLDDQLTLFQLTKGLNIPADEIAKITLNVKGMHDFNPADGINYVPMPNGTLFVPENFLSTLKLSDLRSINSLIKPDLLNPHFNVGDLGRIDTHFDVGNIGNLSNLSKLNTGDLGNVTVRGIEQMEGFKPIEITNLAHADSIAVVKIGDTISLTGVEKDIAVAKMPSFTGVDHIVTTDLHDQLPRVEIAPAAGAAAIPIHDVLSLVKNVEVAGGNLTEHSLADLSSLKTTIDHSLAGEAGALHGLGAENIAVRAEPIGVGNVGGITGVTTVGGFLADHLALGRQAFDHQITAYTGKIAPDTLSTMAHDFFTQIKDVHDGWRDPRLVDPKFSELQVNRLIDNLPKQFSREFERAGWIDDLGKGIKDDPGYLKLSIDSRVRFDQEIADRAGAGFDRAWSAKNAAFGAGLDLPALKLALAGDLKTALGRALERDDWMRKAGAAFEHGLGENAGIAGRLPPAELAKFRQDFLGTAEKLFQDAKANKLDFSADVQDGLAGALTHDLHSKLAEQIAKISKVNSNGLKARAIASDWAAANPHEAQLVGDAGIQRLLDDLNADLRKIAPGSRPQIYNQVLKNFAGKLAFEADLRTVLADAAHAFRGAPEDAAKFRETTILAYLSDHRLPGGMPHGMTPDVAKSWLSWEKENGDVFGSTLSHLHPVDKDAAWSQTRIDLAKDVQPKIQLEKQIAPKIDTALEAFDAKVDKWAEDHGSIPLTTVKAWRDEFDKALRDAGPTALFDPAAFDKLSRNLLDGLDGRLGSDAEAAALKGQADLRFQNGVKAWVDQTGKTPSFFGFTKLADDFQAHLADLLGGARHGLADGGGLDVAKFTEGLDDYLAGLGAKLDKEAGLGALEADAFEKAYGTWLGHDVPLDGGFSADRLTDLAAEFRNISRTLTDHLGPAEAKPIIDDLASRLPGRFDLELRISSRADALDDAFTHAAQDWHGPAGMRDLTDPEMAQVRAEFADDAKDLMKVPDTFWTGGRFDAKQIRAIVAGWDSRLDNLVSAIPGRLNFEAHLLDELSHASELLGDGARFDHIAQQFREDFTHGFHDVWGNGRNADDWLAKEQRNGDVFSNGPGVQVPKNSLELRPLETRLVDTPPAAAEPRPYPEPVAGTWGKSFDLTAWDKVWHHDGGTSGHVAELGDHPIANPHPVVDVPSADGGVFLHPDLPGGGRFLPGGLLLSQQPKDIALAAKLPSYDGAFLLVTHFDDVRGRAHVNDVPVPPGKVGGYFKSGLLPWTEGQLIVVVGCGAEDLAATLRTELHTPTVGETHDFVMTHDGNDYTGHVAWSGGGPDARITQPEWRPTPDVLEAGLADEGGARFKLFLPGDLETEPYLLGSDFGQAMRRLGFDPVSSVSTLDYLGKLAKFDDGPLAIKAGLQSFVDKVFAAHLPPVEDLKTPLSGLGRRTDLGVDWKSGGLPIDQDLRTYLRDLTGLEAKGPDAARDWRLNTLKQDPDLGQALKDHLFPEGNPPRRLYFGHSDVGVPDGYPVAGHDFVDVISRIERGTTPALDVVAVVHVGTGYADHWSAALSDGRGLDELKAKFAAAGASEIEVVRFDDLGMPGSRLGTLSTGVNDGVHVRLTLVGDAATVKPLLKGSEPLVLVTGAKGAADALSAGKALLYQDLDHVGAAGEARFLDQLADWGTVLGGKYSPMTNMLYAFSKHDLFQDTTDPTRLKIVADLAKNDLHLPPWREFSDLIAVGHDANVAQLGQFSRKVWEQGPAGAAIKDAVKTLTEVAEPTLKDLDAFEKRISELVGTTGKWSSDAGKDLDALLQQTHDLHFTVGARNYRVTVRDDQLNPTLQNPWLILPDVNDNLHLQVGRYDGSGVRLGQFCGYLSVHWLTQTDHSVPLGFKDLGPLQNDAVRTVTDWMTGGAGAGAAAVGNAAIDHFTVMALSGDRPAVLVGLDGFIWRLGDLPDGTRIVYSTGGHAMAAVLEDGGGVRVFDPDRGDTLFHFPDRQSFLDDDFTQRAVTFVFDDRVVTPPPPPHPPALTSPKAETPALKEPTTETPAPKEPSPETSAPLTTTPVDIKPTTDLTDLSHPEPVLDADPLTHNPWAIPDPARVVENFTAFVDAVRDLKPESPANPWSQITVLGRDGKPTGEVYAVDPVNGRWVRLGAADPDGAAHLWDGSRGPYLGKGSVTVRPNGDLILVGEDKKPFYLKENLGDGRFVEVFRGVDGKRHWFEWKGDGPTRELLWSGKRIYETNADGAVYKDFYPNGSLARDYRVTLDKGLIRAERGLGNLHDQWVWTRYDKDGNFVAKGIREYNGSAWKDTLSFGDQGSKVDVVVARQWSMWFTKWGHAGHFREHTIDIKDGKLGDPLKTLHTYKEISPQDKETGTSEFIGKNKILVVQRVAEQRIPTWFARHFAEIDVPNRGLFGGVDFPAGGVFGGDSRFQLYAWTEHEIVPGVHDGTAVGAPLQKAGGMRVAIPDGSTFDFVTVTGDAGKDTGVLVRAVVKLDDGTKLEVGRDLDSGKWASLADGVTAADGRTLNWRLIDSKKTVLSQGLRTFGPGHQWVDTLDDAAKTVVRSTDDLGRVTYNLGKDTSVTRDPIGLITKRSDNFPDIGGTGKDEVVVGSGNPLSGSWKWEVTGADGTVTGGLRFPFRSHPDLGSWDDSFVDFQKVDGISKVVQIREIRALDKGRGLAAYKIGDVWRSDIRGLDGTVQADSKGIRQWKADDGTWGPNPKPGTDMQPWRDVPESALGNFVDPPVLRTVVGGKVRLYDIKDGVPNTNVWKEFDHGGAFRDKKFIGVTAGGEDIYRETHAATGQWIETLTDGTRIRYRSLNGFINTRDTFGRWSVKPDFDISGQWKTGGREYEFRGAGTEFRGYNRMWREPNRLQYRDVDGVDGQFVNPNWLKAQKVLLDFIQDYTFDVIANILITGAVNNWNFSPADWGKIFAGGAVSSGVKSASNALQETLLKKFKDGVGNVDSGKFWGRAPYNHDKTWDNEWAGNENPQRWRSGLYNYSVNNLLTSAIGSFVSTAFTSTVFGIGSQHITVSGLQSLEAGGLGMAGALTGGLLAIGPRTLLHQLGSGRYFHQGGIPDLLITFGEKAFEKWFIGDVLGPALHLKITPVMLGIDQGPWNG